MNGPGKYDDACTQARIATKGKATILIVLEGERGSGFSVQSEEGPLVGTLPLLLRTVADEIEQALYGRKP